jgi:ATP-dependent DNA helicase PIF1
MESLKLNSQPDTTSVEHSSAASTKGSVGQMANSLEDIQDVTEEADVPCCFTTGRAGTGKTFLMRQRVDECPEYGILSSTTGISAINLNATTLNSLLRYFDTASMRDMYLTGSLTRILHDLAKQVDWLVVDECSMMDGDQLSILYRAVQEANRYRDVESPLGILLVGDFAQLPPVKAKWCFESDAWPHFAANTLRLEKVWRQDQGAFLNALNLVRSGDGQAGADALTAAGIQWQSQLDTEFDGTTIVPKNDQVDRFNMIALDRVRGRSVTVGSRRWGQVRGEWKNIPERLQLKIGAYVMLLSNAPGFAYVNGDCGWIRGYSPATEYLEEHFTIELVRTKQVVEIYPLVRGNDLSDKPSGWYGENVNGEDIGYLPKPHYRIRKKRYVTAQVEYFPLRLAYASTVHRSQGLTLDRVQFDVRNPFAGACAMSYVAISRCRTLEGLRIVGQPDVFAKRVKTDPRVEQWL